MLCCGITTNRIGCRPEEFAAVVGVGECQQVDLRELLWGREVFEGGVSECLQVLHLLQPAGRQLREQVVSDVPGEHRMQ